MANRQTRALRKNNLSLKFNKGVDFTGARTRNDPNPELALVERPLVRGRCVDSTSERRRKAYRAPHVKEHSWVTMREKHLNQKGIYEQQGA
jgi:hypothetical protein